MLLKLEMYTSVIDDLEDLCLTKRISIPALTNFSYDTVKQVYLIMIASSTAARKFRIISVSAVMIVWDHTDFCGKSCGT